MGSVDMTIPKKLEEKRDLLAAEKKGPYNEVYKPMVGAMVCVGFDEACNLLLPEIEKIHTALKEWIDFEHSQIDKEGPYVGMEINRLINQGDKALASLEEFLNGGEND